MRLLGMNRNKNLSFYFYVNNKAYLIEPAAVSYATVEESIVEGSWWNNYYSEREERACLVSSRLQ